MAKQQHQASDEASEQEEYSLRNEVKLLRAEVATLITANNEMSVKLGQVLDSLRTFKLNFQQTSALMQKR